MAPVGEDGSFWRTVRHDARRSDLLLLSVPLVLVGIWAAPSPVRRALVLTFADPTPLTVFTTHFVHRSPSHLAVNLLVYLLVVPGGYLLGAQVGALGLFRRAYLVTLLVVPPVLGLSASLVADAGIGLGFSGINMALFGVFTLFLGDYLTQHFTAVLDGWGGTLYLCSLASIAGLAVPTTTLSGLLAAAALLGAILTLRTELGIGLHHARRWKQLGYGELALGGLVLFVALPVLAIGADATGRVEVYVHVLGYVLAFVPLYVTVTLGFGGESTVDGLGHRRGTR
jgi:hypothetical protein